MTTQSSEALGQQPAAAGGDSLTVTRTIAHPVDAVWGALMKPHGAEALLGEGGELGEKGAPWHAADGTHGVTRSFHPAEQIRFSWHAHPDAPATVVELDLSVAGDGTRLDITQSHLPADADRQGLTQHWEAALQRLDEMSV